MNVSAVNFTSGKVVGAQLKVPNPKGVVKIENPYKISDILPLSVGLGVGLTFAYFLKTGKLFPKSQNLKNFIAIA